MLIYIYFFSFEDSFYNYSNNMKIKYSERNNISFSLSLLKQPNIKDYKSYLEFKQRNHQFLSLILKL
jgi:hypothetical protein